MISYPKYLFLSILIFAGCKYQQELSENKYESLLENYQAISFDTLAVFSSHYPDSDSFKFKGAMLDSINVVLLTNKTDAYRSFYHEFYSCYKFQIDSVRTGLITRTPGAYESSLIKMFVYDNQQDTIIENIELAETWGDAGFSYERKSWLYRDSNKKLKQFSWILESTDNSVENPNDTTTTERNYYHLVDLSKKLHDTISRNAKYISRRFTGEKLSGNFWIDRFNIFLNPAKDSIGGKPVTFYLNHPKVNQIAKDFYNGKFRPGDNDSTARLLALVITDDEEIRPFYRWCLDQTIQLSDGALGEYPGEPALQYAMKFPKEFLIYMKNDKSNRKYKNWIEIINYSGIYNFGNKTTVQIRKTILDEMMRNCTGCTTETKNQIQKFVVDAVPENINID